MPDNSAKIAELEAKLQRGATSVSVDGVSTSFDLAEIRRELDRLRAADTSARSQRPVAASIYLGGF